MRTDAKNKQTNKNQDGNSDISPTKLHSATGLLHITFHRLSLDALEKKDPVQRIPAPQWTYTHPHVGGLDIIF